MYDERECYHVKSVLQHRRVIMTCKGDILGHWDLEWSHTWEQLREPPTVAAKGINFVLKVLHIFLDSSQLCIFFNKICPKILVLSIYYCLSNAMRSIRLSVKSRCIHVSARFHPSVCGQDCDRLWTDLYHIWSALHYVPLH